MTTMPILLPNEDSLTPVPMKKVKYPMNLDAEPLVVQFVLGQLTVRFLRPGDEHIIPKMRQLLKYRRDLEGNRDFLGEGFYIPKTKWCHMKPVNQNFHVIALLTQPNSTNQILAGVCTFTRSSSIGTIVQIKKNFALNNSLTSLVEPSLIDFVEARLWEVPNIKEIRINADNDNTNFQTILSTRNPPYIYDMIRKESHKYKKEVCLALTRGEAMDCRQGGDRQN